MTASHETMRREFADPPAEYGLYPCWWWEGAPVNRAKITWQLEEMKRVGTFGTFFYLRFSADESFAVVPAYGSDEFLELFRYSLEEHRRLGMEAYFSEWTGQRSVAAQILSDPTAYAALAGRRLVLHEHETASAGPVQMAIPPDEEVLSAAAYRMLPSGLDEGSRRELTDTVEDGHVRWDAPGAGWLLTVVTSQTHGLDYLNHAVADRWVENQTNNFGDLFKLLLDEGTITQEVVGQMRSWRHSGFSVDKSVALAAGDTAGLERLAVSHV